MNIDNLFKAVKIIEEDGIDGINSATTLVGKKTALTLLITHLRRNMGSMDTFPADPVIDEKVKEVLKENHLLEINSFRGEYRFLSNFWLVDVEFEGMIYPSVEHAYQAAKSNDLKIREKIKHFVDPADAKALSETMKIRPDWNNEMRLSTMSSLLDQKFSVIQNPELALKLDSTGDFELKEGNSWGDIFFGVHKGIGENHLGRLLMEKRVANKEALIKLKDLFHMNKNRIKIAEDLNTTGSHVYKLSQIFGLKIG